MIIFSVIFIFSLLIIAVGYRFYLGKKLEKLQLKQFEKMDHMHPEKSKHLLLIHFSSDHLNKLEEILCKEEIPALSIIFIGPQWMFNVKEKAWTRHRLTHIAWKKQDDDFIGISTLFVRKENSKVVFHNDAVKYLKNTFFLNRGY
ncbi:hypothetical protein [Paenibacillus sp. 481]|uniref:hypothetical protein n=1 Tax=Paenibacillus sp. 481 TaxID=2835869 RepID=UPI001E62FCFC|nr:hypothetical protein [Paenibacillus sp. 481]UHA75188.1 hypothetical protein KIK04_09270 [Paenibacillus sp. 481]